MMNFYFNGQRVDIPQLMAAATTNNNNQTRNTFTFGSDTRNTTKWSKKYYCSYGHGQNNSHNSQQCNRRKKLADNVYRPTYPTQTMLRQEVSRPAHEDFVAVKAEAIKKEDVDDENRGEDVLAHYSHAELRKMFGNVLVRSSYTELMEMFQEVKKEMERRGIR
ncbi:hypothetical protein KCU81_g4385, partial [Aureobasidium melanogenum]|uniref:Uncharacterized protein n=1 Tax=Aureobasidium melanogenum (strain CBS 110374) TaxID=1043003 RepID=A0A074W578_AURM1